LRPDKISSLSSLSSNKPPKNSTLFRIVGMYRALTGMAIALKNRGDRTISKNGLYKN